MARIATGLNKPKVKHYHGMPPELTEGHDFREELPLAQLLVIQRGESGIFLYRYTADGNCVGDTWHRTVQDAQAQATFEFEGLLSKWVQVPPEEKDLIAFGLKIPSPEP
ncbi:MAG: hypothetical protein ABI945_02350 [Nitrospirales bacterium]